MERDNNEQWGNIELPGLSDDILLNPNLNKILANRASAKDPKWQEKVKNASSQPDYIEKKRAIALEVLKRPDYREKMLKIYKDPERNKKISQAATDRVISSESRQKMSAARKGKLKSDQMKQRLSISRKGKSQPRVICPHCGISSSPTNIVRWHGDKCKNKLSPTK